MLNHTIHTTEELKEVVRTIAESDCQIGNVTWTSEDGGEFPPAYYYVGIAAGLWALGWACVDPSDVFVIYAEHVMQLANDAVAA